MSASVPVQGGARYTRVAVLFHWALAILLIGTFIGGELMVREWVPNRFVLYQWHKTFGILILVLTAGRLLWRLTHKPPALPADTPRWQSLASHATHWSFYVLMVAMPLLGWAMVSASSLPVPTELFGVIPLPDLPVTESEAVENRFKDLHHTGAKVFFALFVLHVGAALWHQFGKRDGLLSRMSLRRN